MISPSQQIVLIGSCQAEIPLGGILGVMVGGSVQSAFPPEGDTTKPLTKATPECPSCSWIGVWGAAELYNIPSLQTFIKPLEHTFPRRRAGKHFLERVRQDIV